MTSLVSQRRGRSHRRVAPSPSKRLAAGVAVIGIGGALVVFDMPESRITALRIAPATIAIEGQTVGRRDVISTRSLERRAVPAPRSRRTALVVGLNVAKGSSPLPGSVANAKQVNKALRLYGFRPQDITMLLDGAATRPAILRALRSLATRTAPDGVAVFALSAHSRRRGGVMGFRTAEGARISAPELASALRSVRARTWVSLATCYAAAYALPGIVGPRRVATFASSATQLSYQIGRSGSYLVLEMVKHGMIEGGAPRSVESAFLFARRRLQQSAPARVPLMSDGVRGDLVLGPVTWNDPDPVPQPTPTVVTRSSAPNESEPAPTPTPAPRRRPVDLCIMRRC